MEEPTNRQGKETIPCQQFSPLECQHRAVEINKVSMLSSKQVKKYLMTYALHGYAPGSKEACRNCTHSLGESKIPNLQSELNWQLRKEVKLRQRSTLSDFISLNP
jgi:hypothetical protein